VSRSSQARSPGEPECRGDDSAAHEDVRLEPEQSSPAITLDVQRQHARRQDQECRLHRPDDGHCRRRQKQPQTAARVRSPLDGDEHREGEKQQQRLVQECALHEQDKRKPKRINERGAEARGVAISASGKSEYEECRPDIPEDAQQSSDLR
jgi:hypothetical protein